MPYSITRDQYNLWRLTKDKHLHKNTVKGHLSNPVENTVMCRCLLMFYCTTVTDVLIRNSVLRFFMTHLATHVGLVRFGLVVLFKAVYF